ncbi:MAG: DUF4097 family beta strand repeat protein [Paraglaciecola sp.]|nr:DUF4097 family beta strand repeat protein [Paraglaciecola sp.]NCT47023.1 DUF4097 family beta strand repeat protein [Paraglaciecola sp.]
MNTLVKTSTFISKLAACSLLLLSTALHAQTYNERFDVTPGAKLHIKTDVGSIDINTHTQNTIELEIIVDNDEDELFTYTTELDNGNLSVIGKLNSPQRWAKNLQVKFILNIPQEYDVDLNTSGGSLNIENLVGELKARTSGGSITVGNVKGYTKLHTSGGSINTKAISGNLNAHTSGGSIKVTIDQQLTADASLHTSGGSITASILESVQMDINAATSGGRVSTNFAVEGSTKKQSIKGKINGGGPLLTLKTSGGSVRINKI